MQNRIKELRKHRGWSLEEFGHRIGCSKQHAGNLENGKANLTQKWMEKIAAAFGVEPAELLPLRKRGGGEIAQKSAKQEIINHSGEQLGGVSLLPPMKRDLPIYGRIQRVGQGVLMISANPAPSGFTSRPGQLDGVEDAFAFYVPDDRMSPKFEPGGEAWVNPNLPLALGKAVLLIRHTDEATLAYLHGRTAGHVTLRHINPDATFDVPNTEIRDIYRVIGGLDPL